MIPHRHRRRRLIGLWFVLFGVGLWLVWSAETRRTRGAEPADPGATPGIDLRASAVREQPETETIQSTSPPRENEERKRVEPPAPTRERVREAIAPAPLRWPVVDGYGQPMPGVEASLWIEQEKGVEQVSVVSDEHGKWSLPAKYTQPSYRFLRVQPKEARHQIQGLGLVQGFSLPERSLVRCTPSATLKVAVHRLRGGQAPSLFALRLENRRHPAQRYLSSLSEAGSVTLHVPPGTYDWGLYFPQTALLSHRPNPYWPSELTLRSGVTHSVNLREPKWSTDDLSIAMAESHRPWLPTTRERLRLTPLELPPHWKAFHWQANDNGTFSVRNLKRVGGKSSLPWTMRAVPTSFAVLQGSDETGSYQFALDSVLRHERLHETRQLVLGSFASTNAVTEIRHLDRRTVRFAGLDWPWVSGTLQRPAVALQHPGHYQVISNFEAGSWFRSELLLHYALDQSTLQVDEDLEFVEMRGADSQYKRAVLGQAPPLRWTIASQNTPYRLISVDHRAAQGQPIALPFAKASSSRIGRLHWANEGQEGRLGLGALELDASRTDLSLEDIPIKVEIHCRDHRGRPVPHAMFRALASWTEGVQVAHADARGQVTLFVLGEQPIFLSPGPAPFSKQVRIDPTQGMQHHVLHVPSHETRLHAFRKKKSRPPSYRDRGNRYTARLIARSGPSGQGDWTPEAWLECDLEPDGSLDAPGLLPGPYRLEVHSQDLSGRMKSFDFVVGLEDDLVEVRLRL